MRFFNLDFNFGKDDDKELPGAEAGGQGDADADAQTRPKRRRRRKITDAEEAVAAAASVSVDAVDLMALRVEAALEGPDDSESAAKDEVARDSVPWSKELIATPMLQLHRSQAVRATTQRTQRGLAVDGAAADDGDVPTSRMSFFDAPRSTSRRKEGGKYLSRGVQAEKALLGGGMAEALRLALPWNSETSSVVFSTRASAEDERQKAKLREILRRENMERAARAEAESRHRDAGIADAQAARADLVRLRRIAEEEERRRAGVRREARRSAKPEVQQNRTVLVYRVTQDLHRPLEKGDIIYTETATGGSWKVTVRLAALERSADVMEFTATGQTKRAAQEAAAGAALAALPEVPTLDFSAKDGSDTSAAKPLASALWEQFSGGCDAAEIRIQERTQNGDGVLLYTLAHLDRQLQSSAQACPGGRIRVMKGAIARDERAKVLHVAGNTDPGLLARSMRHSLVPGKLGRGTVELRLIGVPASSRAMRALEALAHSLRAQNGRQRLAFTSRFEVREGDQRLGLTVVVATSVV